MQINSPTDLSTEDLSEEQEIYKENIIDHYKHPHNFGTIKNPTITEEGLNPMCGDHIIIYLLVKEKVIEDIKFQGDGCAISKASISLLTDEITGKTIDQVNEMSKDDIYALLGIPISHTRTKCALLSLKTVHAALNKE